MNCSMGVTDQVASESQDKWICVFFSVAIPRLRLFVYIMVMWAAIPQHDEDIEEDWMFSLKGTIRLNQAFVIDILHVHVLKVHFTTLTGEQDKP
jgi:hypothetical protein